MDLSAEYGTVDLQRLKERSLVYAEEAHADPDVRAQLTALLNSQLAEQIVNLTEDELSAMLITDAYKPKMFNVYAEHLPGVKVDFALNVRKSPFTLDRMRGEDPELYASFLEAASRITETVPMTPRTAEVLRRYFNLEVSQALLQRGRMYGVAPISWQDIDGRPMAFASGTAEGASSVETTLTQLVQRYAILAQVREIRRRTGILLDRTERLANSLGKLAGVVSKLNTHLRAGKEAVFAGRRSSDRLYLLLQNAFCAAALEGYTGTSSVYAVELLDQLLQRQGLAPQQRRARLGQLVGTHAHEVMSIFGQLLASHDDAAADAASGPIQVSAMTAHLAFIRTSGQLSRATALPDTFGTRAFVAAAAATRLPSDVVADLEAHCSDDKLPPVATVFDVFRVWRMDSGDYATEAEHVVSTWERRCRERTAAGLQPLPKPQLMYSDLKSVDHVIATSRLPERIRPDIFAFGTLADGFLPFQLPDGSQAEIEMTSVVMKAVQARHPAAAPIMACAGKVGDGVDYSKMQVDARLPEAEQQAVKDRMVKMSKQYEIKDATRLASELSRAYKSVVLEGKFH